MSPRVASGDRGTAVRVGAVLVAAVLLLFPLATGLAAAGSVGDTAGRIVVEEGETVDRVDGIAGTIVVRGTVAGDVAGVAGSVRIADTGTVEGSVSAAAGSLTVDGTVEGDVTAGVGSFALSETGRVGGSIDVGAGSVAVNGAVGGDVRAGGERVVLGPTADVDGEFRYDAAEFSQSPDASVAGGVVEDPSLRGDVGIDFDGGLVPGWLGAGYGLAADLLLGAVLLLAFPRFSGEVAAGVADDPLVSGGVGFLFVFAVPILLLVVAVTVIGIPLALVGVLGYVAAVWIGSVYGQYAAAAWALGRVDADNRWAALVGGLVAFTLVGLVPILGGLVEFGALLLGVGALGIGLRDRYRGRRRTDETTERPTTT